MQRSLRILRIVGLTLVSLLAAASAFGTLIMMAVSDLDTLTPVDVAWYAAWAIIVLLALCSLWSSAYEENPPTPGVGKQQAVLALVIGVAAAVGPFSTIFHDQVALMQIFMSAGLAAPAGIWLASEARRRGAGALGMVAIIFCSIGIVYVLMGFAAAAFIPFPTPS